METAVLVQRHDRRHSGKTELKAGACHGLWPEKHDEDRPARYQPKRNRFPAERETAQDEQCRYAGTDCRHRSEEHTSELQSLMRISYAVFCLKKKRRKAQQINLLKNNHQNKHTIEKPKKT